MKTEHALPGRAKPRARVFDRPAYANVLGRLEKSGRWQERSRGGSSHEASWAPRASVAATHGARHRPPRRGGVRPQDPISHLGSSLAYIPSSLLLGPPPPLPVPGPACHHVSQPCATASGPRLGWPCGRRLQIPLPYMELILFERKIAVHTGTAPSFRPLYRTRVHPVLPGSLRTIIPLAPAPAFVPFD